MKCDHCKRRLRPQGAPREPGTVRVYARHLCSACYAKSHYSTKRLRADAGPAPHLGRTVRPVDTSWHERGACRGVPLDVAAAFYQPEGERGSAKQRRELAAKAICITCPVRELCRDDARKRREPFGVWGMESETEREQWLAEQRAASSPQTERAAS